MIYSCYKWRATIVVHTKYRQAIVYVDRLCVIHCILKKSRPFICMMVYLCMESKYIFEKDINNFVKGIEI